MSSLELDFSDGEYGSFQESDYDGANESGPRFQHFKPYTVPDSRRQRREVSMVSETNSSNQYYVCFPCVYDPPAHNWS
jgi:hypothetical protein